MTHDYVYLESTQSICNICKKLIPAKILRKKDWIFIRKTCLEHWIYDELLEENPAYYLKKSKYYKPWTSCKTQTIINKWCPWDCWLCPNHEQHTCIGLIEITNKCNMNCPICYASAWIGDFLELSKIEKMMDFYQDTEYGKADILQISWWEPTLHPDILAIIDIAKTKWFKYIMLNTNWVKIAEDEEFAKELWNRPLGFEVYLQFDSFNEANLIKLRNGYVLDIKLKAIKNLQKYKVPMTLVSTISEWVNEDEIWKIVEFGMKEEYIRWVNFQPVAFFGRSKKIKESRITLSWILDRLQKQSEDFIKFDDFIPLPCDPDRVALTYLHKWPKSWQPIMHKVDVSNNLWSIKNTFAFDLRDIIEEEKDWDCCAWVCNPFQGLTKILEPKLILMSREKQSEYVNNYFFRISVKSFIDIYNFDIKSVQKDCVHIITPDLKKYPFSTYNMFYRNI